MKTLGVGKKINIYRRAIGLTLGAFAKKCQVPEKTIEAVCIQGRDPSGKTFWHICHYGGMSPDVIDTEDWGRGDLI